MLNSKSSKTSSATHVFLIDVLRGFAIASVFLFHALGAAYGKFHLPWQGIFPDFHEQGTFKFFYLFSLGYIGVPIFFVVSGFCIHLSYESSTPNNWASFFKKRLFRIYPAYLLAILLFFAPIQMYPLPPDTKWWSLFTHIFFIHNLSESTYYMINPSFWSIAIEMQLYLIYPFFRFLIKRCGWCNSLTILALIEITIKTAKLFSDSLQKPQILHLLTASPLAYWFSWGLGAFVCEKWRLRENNPLNKINIYWVLCLALIATSIRPLTIFSFTSVAFLTAAFLSQKLSKPSINNKTIWLANLTTQHLASLGTISFSFYLLHQPIISKSYSIIYSFLPKSFIPSMLMFIVMLVWYPIIFAVSYLIYKYFERPFIKFARDEKKCLCCPGSIDRVEVGI